MKTPITIKTLSTFASSGKSYTSIEYLVDHLNNHKDLSCLFTVTTNPLGKETETKFIDSLARKNVKIPVYLINGDSEIYKQENLTNISSVKNLTEKYMRNSDQQKIIITSHETLINLCPQEFGRASFKLVMDEAPEVLQGDLIKSEYMDIITDRFEVINEHEISAKVDKAIYEEITKIANGEFQQDTLVGSSSMRNLCKSYLSKAYDLEPTVHYKQDTKRISSIEYRAVLTPEIVSGFHDVTILAANFESTLLYQIWSKKYKVNFTPDDKLKAQLKYTKHSNTDRTTIYYLQETKPWITTNFPAIDQKRATEEILSKHALNGVNGSSFIFRFNGAKKDINEAKVLSGRSHGQNCYQDINNCIYLSTHAPDKNIRKWLISLKITEDEIKKAYLVNDCYQAIMRCAIRDHANSTPISIFVGSKEIAEKLNDIFNGECLLKHYPVDCIDKLVKVNKKLPTLTASQKKFSSRLGMDINSKYNLTDSVKEISKYIKKLLHSDDKLSWKEVIKITKSWAESNFRPLESIN